MAQIRNFGFEPHLYNVTLSEFVHKGKANFSNCYIFARKYMNYERV